jgi:hypothetical protein
MKMILFNLVYTAKAKHGLDRGLVHVMWYIASSAAAHSDSELPKMTIRNVYDPKPREGERDRSILNRSNSDTKISSLNCL